MKAIRKFFFYTRFSFFILLPFLLSYCNQNKKNTIHTNIKVNAAPINNGALKAIAIAKLTLEDGMLITRSDDDFESLTIQNFSTRDKTYSHAGLVFKEEGDFVVYHCMAGKENPDGYYRRDAFDNFVSPTQKTGLGIFKYQLTDKETKDLHLLVQQNFTAKIPFDNTFNLLSDDSLYCSEMIVKNLKRASKGRLHLPTSSIANFKPKIMGYQLNNTFFKQFEYIGIDDLYMNLFCKQITRIKY